MIVAPSILAADFSNLQKEVDKVATFGAEFLHIDVMDGHFVPNITLGPCVVKNLQKTNNILFDVHLMITSPRKYYKDFIKANADIITFHVEVEDDIDDVINLIKKENVKVGLSIKPNTNVEKIVPYLSKLDLVLVMSVEPGFGGQKFMDIALNKIRFLKDYKEKYGLNYIIEVDGGINSETGKKASLEGADALVAGSYLFSDDMEHKIKLLQDL